MESSLEGKLVCDEAIGLLKSPITIYCEQGKAVKIEGETSSVIDRVKKALSTDRIAQW